MGELQSIKGIVSHIVYRNDTNGYTVFELSVSGQNVTCVGNIAQLNEGESAEISGDYTEHPVYGRQFKVGRYTRIVPETPDAIELYIGSGSIKGVGRKLAARIVAAFGTDTIRIMEEEPERLAEIKGISERLAGSIGAQAGEQADIRRAVMFLEQYEIPLSMALRIYKRYGDDIYALLKEDPYRLAGDVDGIGFIKADRIARAAGFSMDSVFRIKSGVVYVLQEALGEGNVYLPRRILTERASALLEIDDERIDDAISDLAVETRIIIKKDASDEDAMCAGDAVYLARFYYLELASARMLTDLSHPLGEKEKRVEKKIRDVERDGGLVLEDEQRAAIRAAAMNGLVIITGGPGTGKTTSINAIIRYFREDDLTVALAAPTGRAAKRMTEATGYEASTIHRLLEISVSEDDEDQSLEFARNAANPLEADVVIIDEMSMVDISLFYALLSALGPGTRLILTGDVDQLPSVGPGAVLRDIIDSGAFPVIRLERIFRQSSQSDIVINAHRINRGEPVSLDNDSREFFFLKRNDVPRMISNMIELVRDRLPSYVGAEPFDIQILSPTRKGSLGVERLNAVLQEHLNPPKGDKAEKVYGDRLFRVGDKVMQTRNNYQISWEVRGRYGIPLESGSGIFNGDMGIIREIDDFSKQMVIEFDEGRFVDYPYSDLDDIELSYAVTIHKSQGSEYPAVVLPILSGPRMLMTRNLLYTAVTRARSCVVILGSSEAVEQMIDNKSERERYTSLDTRINELWENIQ